MNQLVKTPPLELITLGQRRCKALSTNVTDLQINIIKILNMYLSMGYMEFSIDFFALLHTLILPRSH